MDNHRVRPVPFPLELSMKISMRLIPYIWAFALWLPAAGSLAVASPASPASHAPKPALVTAVDAVTSEPQDLRRDVADAYWREVVEPYWREVAERLLAGQPSAGTCSPARDAGSCLLAARLLSSSDSGHEQARGGGPQQSDRKRMRSLLAAAAARAEEDPLLYRAMTWDVFKREFPELRERTLIELRRREPDNLQVWLMSLAGETWTQERLEAAARSTRLETHLYPMLRADLERLAGITSDAPAVDGLPFEPTSVESVQVILEGMLMAETMPDLRGLIESCSAVDSAVQADLHADCWRIAERLVGHAESVVDLALGSALMRRIARDPLQRERAAQARIDYEYLQQGVVETLKSGEQQRLFMQRIREPGGTEISATRLTLVDVGLPPELPPAR